MKAAVNQFPNPTLRTNVDTGVTNKEVVMMKVEKEKPKKITKKKNKEYMVQLDFMLLVKLDCQKRFVSYSKAVLDHYNNPRNVGVLNADSKDVGTGIVGAPACGDVMKLQIKVY